MWTESTSLVKCVAILNCSKCDEIISEEFSGLILLPVIADTDYHISVQVFRPDTDTILEDYRPSQFQDHHHSQTLHNKDQHNIQVLEHFVSF